MVAYPARILDEVVALCEADPERERCGLVVERAGVLEVIPVENVARPRDAYELDPAALLRIHRELRSGGGSIVAAWHSHVEGGALLSARDREGAMVEGNPVLPGAEQLVVALGRGRAVELRRYLLGPSGFVERPLG